MNGTVDINAFSKWLTEGEKPRFTSSSAKALLHVLESALVECEGDLKRLERWANSEEGRVRAMRRTGIHLWQQFLNERNAVPTEQHSS